MSADCPAAEMNARGSAVHPLHVRLDRQAQGRGAHHRRLSRLRRHDAPVRVRLSRRRHLLVHRRRRLGDRAQLHRLRPARQRRHHADVRGRAELPDRLALLARHRQVGRQHLLHRADRDPRADGRRRRPGQAHRPLLAAPAGLGRRADQPRGVGVVLPRGRRQPLPDRRHLVADGDRRHHDHAAAGRDRAKPGSATRPFFGVKPALVDDKGNTLEGAAQGNLVILDSWPGQLRTIYGDHERFVQTYFSTYQGTYFTGDGCRRDEDGYYWITGRVDDVINVSGHRLGTAEVERAGRAPEGGRGRRRRLPARPQGPGHLLLCHAERRRAGRATRCARSSSATCAR